MEPRQHSDNNVRLNTKDNVPFVMKLDVNSTNGVGTGTSGWARVLDEDDQGVTLHPGGAAVTDIHGDANGGMILTYTGYADFNATYYNPPDYRGRPQPRGKMLGGVHYLMKLGGVGLRTTPPRAPFAPSRLASRKRGEQACGEP